jgi:pimeloyl-ACP methyl ester carboxylesterase
VELAYDRLGSGPPLVLLHGVGHRRQAWTPVLDRLVEHREVFCVDFPGFGESPPLPPGVPYEEAAIIPLLADFFERMGLDRPHVAGNSMGGYVSLVLAQRGMARSATALSPAGLWTPTVRRWALTMVRSVHRTARHLPPKLANRLAQSAFGRTLMTGVIFARPSLLAPGQVLEDMQALITAVGFRPALAAGETLLFGGEMPDVPVTVAWGGRDLIVFRPRARLVKSLIPQATLLRLPGCGHVPMSDNPALVAHVLLSGSDDGARGATSDEPPLPLPEFWSA